MPAVVKGANSCSKHSRATLAHLVLQAYNNLTIDACGSMSRQIMSATFHCDFEATEMCEAEDTTRGTFNFVLKGCGKAHESTLFGDAKVKGPSSKSGKHGGKGKGKSGGTTKKTLFVGDSRRALGRGRIEERALQQDDPNCQFMTESGFVFEFATLLTASDIGPNISHVEFFFGTTCQCDNDSTVVSSFVDGVSYIPFGEHPCFDSHSTSLLSKTMRSSKGSHYVDDSACGLFRCSGPFENMMGRGSSRSKGKGSADVFQGI